MSPVARDAGYPAIWGGKVAARAGIEPATNGLTVRHSTAELPGREVERAPGFEPGYPAWKAGAQPICHARNLKEHGNPELVQRHQSRCG